MSAPDWLVAKLGAKGDYELEGVKGNFKAKYASDNSTAVHMLSIDDYAAPPIPCSPHRSVALINRSTKGKELWVSLKVNERNEPR